MNRRTVLRELGAALACLALSVGCSNKEPAARGAGAAAGPDQRAGDAKAPAPPAAPVKLTVGHDLWIGYAGVFLANELGYFKEAGLDVGLKPFSNPGDTLAALASSQLDIGLTTLQNLAVVNGNGDTDIVAIALIDSSNGADAVVAREGIASMADLKGKTVALTLGEVNHMLFLLGLEKAGLRADDVKITSMSADDAGAAFVAGKVDAAVTWEPWITKATKGGGHVIFSSASVPDTIADSVAVRRSRLAEGKDAYAKFLGAIDRGVRSLRSDPDKALPIVGKYLNAPAEDVKRMLDGDKIYGLAENKQLFGTADRPGPVYATMKYVVDFAAQSRLVKKAPAPESLLDPGFVR
ncbi:aliphatic sulfonate ABC transporter substrate-binding protein [Sorangium cellulosum]|uniref:Aliphatic sulfonate ABC transporter substrate-binding protein n=1 Tax=Sorangium cellulosum TaxID=56 RepID=A0A4P2Q0B1_SORCE|nr:ABC transporter substrate-binding protein [Sorangium cellulosum]AUX22580.1 aliphatic sulfonate ABC transporter substrate-binding protein [Sorangium cellulosum]